MRHNWSQPSPKAAAGEICLPGIAISDAYRLYFRAPSGGPRRGQIAGQVETANYRTVRIPTDAEIPVMIKGRFGETHKTNFL